MKRRWLRVVLVAFAALVAARLFAFQSYWADSGNMAPTLLRGDHFLVNDLAYGLRIPFTNARLPELLPHRGDVIVFDVAESPFHPSGGSAVGRVVGLPGDAIDVFGGRLTIDRQPLVTKSLGEVELNLDGDGAAVDPTRVTDLYDLFEERLGDHVHRAISLVGARQIPPIAGTFRVPPGHVFVMGDSRDHSKDSRFPLRDGGYGEIPIELIRGRVVAVVLSRRGRQIRWDRLFHWIE